LSPPIRKPSPSAKSGKLPKHEIPHSTVDVSFSKGIPSNLKKILNGVTLASYVPPPPPTLHSANPPSHNSKSTATLAKSFLSVRESSKGLSMAREKRQELLVRQLEEIVRMEEEEAMALEEEEDNAESLDAELSTSSLISSNRKKDLELQPKSLKFKELKNSLNDLDDDRSALVKKDPRWKQSSNLQIISNPFSVLGNSRPNLHSSEKLASRINLLQKEVKKSENLSSRLNLLRSRLNLDQSESSEDENNKDNKTIMADDVDSSKDSSAEQNSLNTAGLGLDVMYINKTGKFATFFSCFEK
jgi:hypothetical protein